MSLAEIAQEIRLSTVNTIANAGKGHYGGSLSTIEILTAIYFGGKRTTDKFILSKGHAGSALYCTLARAGILDADHLEHLNNGGLLGEEPHKAIPGVEVNTGSLGHGLGLACGLALDAKRKGLDTRTFVLLGDGECWEGAVWEAAMFAAHHKLSITAVVDRNRLAIGGNTEDITALGDLPGKWKAFGWGATAVNGHDVDALARFFRFRLAGPIALIANTIKGRGVSFMEGDPGWHHGKLTAEQLEQARGEIGAA